MDRIRRPRWRQKAVEVLATGVLAAGSLAPASGCSPESSDQMPETEHKAGRATLRAGAAARVGDAVVTVEQVRQLSKEQGISPAAARSKLVYDALMAEGARERGLDQRDAVRVERRGLLARDLLRQLKREAHKAPIDDKEVREFTARHWLDLDRPVARDTIHAVAMPEDPKDEAQRAQADEIAQRIAEAVRSAPDAKTFEKRAKEVDSEGMEVKVQELEPVTADGRVADLEARRPPGAPPRTYDANFVEAVYALEEVGDISAPFRSPFGTHVVMLVSTQDAKRVPLEKRRQLLTPEIHTHRAKRRMDDLVASLRSATPPEVSRNASSVLQLIPEEAFERGR